MPILSSFRFLKELFYYIFEVIWLWKN